MSMIMGLVTLSDANVERVIADPPLVWQVVAPDDPEPYETARAAEAGRRGFFARLFHKTSERVPDLVLSDHQGADVDIDKAWHAIHYLLTGTAWAGSPPLNFLLDGGRTAGNIEVGYGPVRLYKSAEVRQIHEQLSDVTDDALRARFNPDEMLELEIYPEIWDRAPEDDDTIGYVMKYLSVLRDHLDTAVKRGVGLAIYLS